MWGSISDLLKQSLEWLTFRAVYNINLTERRIGFKDLNSFPMLILYVGIFTAIDKKQFGKRHPN